eukprot:m.247597 g.247597  ORF g.247597 m.247597 type:complete len:120 (-) comp17158_c1_seq4:3061-3420(-)
MFADREKQSMREMCSIFNPLDSQKKKKRKRLEEDDMEEGKNKQRASQLEKPSAFFFFFPSTLLSTNEPSTSLFQSINSYKQETGWTPKCQQTKNELSNSQKDHTAFQQQKKIISCNIGQ